MRSGQENLFCSYMDGEYWSRREGVLVGCVEMLQMAWVEWSHVAGKPDGLPVPTLECGSRSGWGKGWMWCARGLWVETPYHGFWQKLRDYFWSRQECLDKARTFHVGPPYVWQFEQVIWMGRFIDTHWMRRYRNMWGTSLCGETRCHFFLFIIENVFMDL